jgi:hypothetical protein
MLSLLAQSERGTISGTIKDPSGAVIPGAKILVTNTATNTVINLTSNGAGDYSAPSLPVGQYNIRVEREGFRPSSLTGITVNAATSVRADITIEVGTSQQVVEVQAQAVQLHTDDAKSSSTITNKLVDELPLVVGGALRSPFDLATLTPEAKQLGGDNGFMLGGGQAASYGTNLDGVSVNTTRALQQSWVAVNAPSLEAITEFTVDTNGFKAEYGHAGGGVMNFVSKSGTNDFHGTAYEFLRNNAMDANNFFNNSKGIDRPIYKQSDFGFSVGGPVWIPKVYRGRNKTFFFTTYEAFRNRNGATGASATIPTPEMYTGDFTNWVDANGIQIPIFDPTTQTTDANGKVSRTQFLGNKVPQSKFDPITQKALAAYTANGLLKPNNGAAPGTAAYVKNNYLITGGTKVQPQTKVSVKGDHLFNEKHRISGYYGYNRSGEQPGALGPPTLPGFYTNYNDLTRNSDVVRFSWDWTLSPTKLNHFYAGGNNWRENHDPPQATVRSGLHWKDKVCLANVPDCDQNLLNIDFNSNGYTSWGGRANNGSENTVYSYNDDFTWIHGAHQIKFGGMMQINHYNGFGRQCISGCVGFSFLQTARPGDSTQTSGNPFASFLVGYANGGSIDTIRFIGQQWPYYAGFIQDDWRINSKLSINYGLRWETQLPPTGLDDKWSDFSPTRPNPRAGNIPRALIYAGSGPGREGSRTLADSYFGAFGPRIGFAYSWNDKTVIRGGYGRSFAAITTVTGSTHQRGFTQTYGIPDNGTNGVLPNAILKDGFPSYPIPPFIDPSFANKDNIPWWQGQEATRPPENNAWNLSVQRQFGSNMVMEVSYNALIGSHLQTQLLNIDQVDPKYLAQYGAALLTTRIDNPAVVATGVKAPYPTFIQDWAGGATLSRALRPFPQYAGIDTYAGGGDHSGHSSYHAGIIRLDKRYSRGLTLQTSYVFSKLLTDSDSYWGSGVAIDQYNRKLEKSIGQFDLTHNFKLGLIYELPFGRGKAYLNHGLGAVLLGGWRFSSIHYYSSGQPLSVSTSTGVQGLFVNNNRATISTYDGWRGATQGGGFDPGVDRFVQPASFFPVQANNVFGNATRYNPKFRQFPNLNENISLGKSFAFTERVRMDFRAEAFNAFNRVRFGTGSLTIQDQTFGKLSSSSDLLNTPRQLQLGLKLYF